MARLRNRIMKAEFWSDPELLRWPRDKRHTYQGLWAIAEDSGCIEDDPFGWKLQIWPSPMDADITMELLEQWRDEFIKAGKLIPYEADGKRYLYCKTFHQHERPRNPQKPDLPLPPWVRYETKTVERADGRTNTIHSYEVDTESVPSPYRQDTESVPAPQSSPVQPRSVQSSPDLFLTGADDAAPDDGDEQESPLTAQSLVAYAADYCQEHGYTLAKDRKGQLGRELKKQFEAGTDPPLIRRGLEELLEANKSPSALGYVIGDLQRGGGNGKYRVLGRDSGRCTDGSIF